MLNYFEPLAEEFADIEIKRIIINSKNFRIFITVASLDLPAKCSIQQITQFNGYNAYNYCHHGGTKTEKGVRYDYKERNIMRTHKDFVKAMAVIDKEPGTIMNGIKGVFPMVAFEGFDLFKFLLFQSKYFG